MRNTLVTVVVAVMASGMAQAVHAQTPAVRVSWSGRAQIQWNTTSVDEVEAGMTSPVAWSTFETRRIRLQASITAGDWVRGVIEPEFALAQLALKQAWIALDFDPAFSLRAGQFKKPFSLILLSSSTQLAPIERGVRIRNLNRALSEEDGAVFNTLDGDMILGEEQTLVSVMQYGDYDIGAAIEGEKAGFEWSLGVFNGAGADTRDHNDSKTFAGRVTYGVPVATGLRLGVAASHRDVSLEGDNGLFETHKGTAYSVDLELGQFRDGVWLVAEAIRGTNLITDETLLGAHAMLSYFHDLGNTRRIQGVEPVGRISYGDPDDTIDGDEGILLTPGINLYMLGRNRLMFNWDLFLPRGDAFSSQHAFRAQLNLHF